LDPAALECLRFQFLVMELQLAPLSDSRGDNFKRSKITFGKADRTESKRSFQVLPVKNDFVLESRGEFSNAAASGF
jgi:hypothetical protein